jgi:hypothetical protein
LELDYVRLSPGFAREVLEIYKDWEDKDTVPMKLRELMTVIEIEVGKLYDPGIRDRVAAMPRPGAERHEAGMKFSTSDCLGSPFFDAARFL